MSRAKQVRYLIGATVAGAGLAGLVLVALAGCGGGGDDAAGAGGTGGPGLVARPTPTWKLSRHYPAYRAVEEKYQKAMHLAQATAETGLEASFEAALGLPTPTPAAASASASAPAPAAGFASAGGFQPLPPPRPDFIGAYRLLTEVEREADPLLGRLELSGTGAESEAAGGAVSPDLKIGQLVRDLIRRSIAARQKMGRRLRAEIELGALIALKDSTEFGEPPEIPMPSLPPTVPPPPTFGIEVPIGGRFPPDIVQATILPGAVPTVTPEVRQARPHIGVPEAIEATPESVRVRPTPPRPPPRPPRRPATTVPEGTRGPAASGGPASPRPSPTTEIGLGELGGVLPSAPPPPLLPTATAEPPKPKTGPAIQLTIKTEKFDHKGDVVLCYFTFNSPDKDRTIGAIRVEFKSGNDDPVCRQSVVFQAGGFQPNWGNIANSTGTTVAAGSVGVPANQPYGFVAAGEAPNAAQATRAYITIMTEDGQSFDGQGGEGLDISFE